MRNNPMKISITFLYEMTQDIIQLNRWQVYKGFININSKTNKCLYQAGNMVGNTTDEKFVHVFRRQKLCQK